MFSYIDATGITTLKNLVMQYEMLGITVLLCGVATHVAKMMAADLNFHEHVPASKIYITIHDAVHMAIESMKEENAQNKNPKPGTVENPYTVIELNDECRKMVTPKVKKKIINGKQWEVEPVLQTNGTENDRLLDMEQVCP